MDIGVDLKFSLYSFELLDRDAVASTIFAFGFEHA